MGSLISFLILVISFAPFSVVHCGGGFSIDLIHRDSPKSPLYDPGLSQTDRLHAAARRSIARANHLRHASSLSVSTNSIESEVIPNSFEYLMSINVGTPPSNILAIADTGSDLTWTQCKPCVSCYKQTSPIFDPKTSSTYRTVSCNTHSCSELPFGGCGEGSVCEYRYDYGDGSFTDGFLSSDSFTFNTDGKRTVSIPTILFGCSHESRGTFDENGAGIVGLGGGPFSLISQLGPSIDNKFSYCLVPYSDANNKTSLLNFGDRANVGPDAVTIPIVGPKDDTFYYLSLEEISVSGETVAFSKLPKPNAAGKGRGNIIIDSGTTLTVLDESMLRPLVDRVSQVVHYPRVQDSGNLFDLCFDISNLSSQNINLPDMTFTFSGKTVKLPPLNTFVMARQGVLCMAFASSGKLGGLAIWGNIAQQNLHIGYNLGARTLSIAPADCAKL